MFLDIKKPPFGGGLVFLLFKFYLKRPPGLVHKDYDLKEADY
jgi:hypothetical protein